MSHPIIPYADVTMYGALDADGEVYKKCRITMNGTPADAVLYANVVDGSHWKRVDRLRSASVVENLDGTLTIVGTSDELVEVVGLRPADSTVRWEVKPWSCAGCR